MAHKLLTDCVNIIANYAIAGYHYKAIISP